MGPKRTIYFGKYIYDEIERRCKEYDITFSQYIRELCLDRFDKLDDTSIHTEKDLSKKAWAMSQVASDSRLGRSSE